jgi:hypothetical protein
MSIDFSGINFSFFILGVNLSGILFVLFVYWRLKPWVPYTLLWMNVFALWFSIVTICLKANLVTIP